MIPGAVGQIRKRPGVWDAGDASISSEFTPENWSYRLIEEKGCCKVVQGIDDKIFVVYFSYNSDGINKWKQILRNARRPLILEQGDKILVFAAENETASDMLIVEERIVRIYSSNLSYYEFRADEEKWVLFDDGNSIKYDDKYVKTPIVMHGCDPLGGGTPFEGINLLSPWVTESFCVKKKTVIVNGEEVIQGETTFHLQGEVDADLLLEPEEEDSDVYRGEQLNDVFCVEVLVSCTVEEGDGETTKWVRRPFEDGGKTVDGYRASGNYLWLRPESNKDEEGNKIGTEHNNKIPPSPIEGQDNVRITYIRKGFRKAFYDLCAAKCATTYGVAGFKDRLFLGGGEFNNKIYYSEMENPYYIMESSHIDLEQGSQVMALSGIADHLVALTQKGIYFVSGQVSDGEGSLFATDALFTVGNLVPAPKPLNIGNVEVFGGELVYLSEDGVIAVTSKDQYSERYAEHRSATVDKKMLADRPRFMLGMGRFLLVFCESGICWLFDENQPNTEGDKPYAAHQYEGYRMDGFDADFAFIDEDGQLMMVKNNRHLKWTDGTKKEHYKDVNSTGEGTAIKAFWETPWILGTKFYLRKNFRRLGLLPDLLAGVDSVVRVEGKKNQEDWKILFDYDGALCSFDYDDIDYQFFTYATAPKNLDIKRKIRIKKATRFKLRFSNDLINKTLILNQWGLDYVQEE